MKWPLHLALAAVLCLGACGTPGAPRPPSLELPRPANDLAATRQGDKVTLTWTAPRETTDKQNIRHPGPVRICRGVNTTAMVECVEVAQLPPEPSAASRKERPELRSYTDTLPMQLQQQNATGFATYSVETLNARGRSAGLSNQVQVPLAPTAEPIPDVTAAVTAEAIVVKFTGFGLGGYSYHVFRSEANTNNFVDVGAAQKENPGDREARLPYQFLDHSWNWEQAYSYRVVSITNVKLADGTEAEVRGDPTPEVKVFAHDIFPPAAPSGLQAVASGVGQPAFVDLSWAPNTEPDLAGYSVYRHEEGQPPVKINTDLVKTPSYRDRSAGAAHKYFYSVTAVDLRGNESAHSAEANESVP